MSNKLINEKLNPLGSFVSRMMGRKQGVTIRKPKVFCIGQNKTGTTTMESVLHDFGYRVGDQAEAELLIHDWARRDFTRIIKYCESADAFQDIPFSLDYTYQILDQVFPESKFILTVRSSADEWYTSLVGFHAKLMGTSDVPIAADLKNFPYRYLGWLWDAMQCIYNINENTLYDPEIFKAHYEFHNKKVLDYFRFRPRDLLVLNLSDDSTMRLLCNFLEIPYTGQAMPHLNRSRD